MGSLNQRLWTMRINYLLMLEILLWKKIKTISCFIILHLYRGIGEECSGDCINLITAEDSILKAGLVSIRSQLSQAYVCQE